MKPAILILCLTLVAAPLSAQEPEQGRSLMQEGARLFFEGLLSEMEPALEDLEGMAREMEPLMRGFIDEMGPALIELMQQIDDWSIYETPEMLPNGDIIIRRKTPLEPDAEGEIEL